MATLTSIPELQEIEFRYEFLVEDLHCPTYDSPSSQMVCSIIGHDNHIYSYLRDQIILDNLTRNEKRNPI